MTIIISLRPMCLRGGGVPGVLAPRWESVVEEVRMEYDVSPTSGDMVIRDPGMTLVMILVMTHNIECRSITLVASLLYADKFHSMNTRSLWHNFLS